MRRIEIGPQDQPIAMEIMLRVDPDKAEHYRQVILSAIREIEKREPQPCHGCGDR